MSLGLTRVVLYMTLVAAAALGLVVGANLGMQALPRPHRSHLFPTVTAKKVQSDNTEGSQTYGTRSSTPKQPVSI